MRSFLYFLLFMVIALVVTFLSAVLGDQGAWYFAWMIGTAMIVLICAAGGALLDTEEEDGAGGRTGNATPRRG